MKTVEKSYAVQAGYLRQLSLFVLAAGTYWFRRSVPTFDGTIENSPRKIRGAALID